MKKKVIIITVAAIVLILIGLIFYFSSNKNTVERNHNKSTTTTTTTTTTTNEIVPTESTTTSTTTTTTSKNSKTSKKTNSTSKKTNSTIASTNKNDSLFSSTTTTTTKKTPSINVDNLLKNVKREKGKVNIYLFYGNGCPHCKLEHEVLDEIKDEYGKYYNLYEFDIWNNKDYYELAHIFAENMNFELRGVPFTVIGEQYMSGFGSESKDILINKIKEEKDKGYDVYFDKIKER